MTQTARLFLGQFARSPHTVGAIFPSSSALAQTMVAPIDFATARMIVEFGPGTGAFTRAIAQRMQPQCRYLGIELNEHFCRALTTEFPRLAFVHGSVANLTRILAAQGIGKIDAIVSGIPWATLPISLQATVLPRVNRALAPGGIFVTFGYLQSLVLPATWALRQRLRRSFQHVSLSPVVFANIPPAFAYVCRKAK
jgi:phosphatidylethanolamine/phosphatidyl-N-methylethanolamine N-methyltransferase